MILSQMLVDKLVILIIRLLGVYQMVAEQTEKEANEIAYQILIMID